MYFVWFFFFFPLFIWSHHCDSRRRQSLRSRNSRPGWKRSGGFPQPRVPQERGPEPGSSLWLPHRGALRFQAACAGGREALPACSRALCNRYQLKIRFSSFGEPGLIANSLALQVPAWLRFFRHVLRLIRRQRFSHISFAVPTIIL